MEFDDFCMEQFPRLVGALGLFCGDRDVAEELAQEALARAWRHWAKVSRADDPKAWLYATALNLARSNFRRLAAERRAMRKVNAQQERQSQEWVDEADALSLRAAVANLPSRYKTVLVLRYFLGMTFPEIADRLDVPLSTVKTWSSRGLNRLQRDGMVQEEAFDAG